MAVGSVLGHSISASDRVRQTVALLRRRGYAVTPSRLAELCVGGPLTEREIRWAVAANRELLITHDLVVEHQALDRVHEIRSRASAHGTDASAYLEMAQRFAGLLVMLAPFVRSVSIAGSLASGGFRASDDVDLNLIVDDGYKHLAYFVLNVLGLAHALGHRAKPVDDLTRRPLAPRVMTANLILERSQCFPLRRQDEDMAFELLICEPVFGLEVINEVIDANPSLLDHFPQLASKPAPLLIRSPAWRLPNAAFPKFVDGAAHSLGAAAWRYMQWTRRHRPDALARVAYVRATMWPYALFDE